MSVAPSIPAVQPNRSFNALNGNELKKAILTQIQRQMDADTRFSQHLAYGRCAWRFKIAIDTYPNDMDRKFEVESGADLMPPQPRREIGPDEKPVQIDIEGERTVAAPVAGDTADQVRRDSGLPVPKTHTVAGPEGSRIQVDAPEVPIPSADAEQSPTARVQSSGTHASARSVAVRTRANPKGVTAPETAGSAPSEADMAKIIEKELAAGTIKKAE
jgi:hypothetical protein